MRRLFLCPDFYLFNAFPQRKDHVHVLCIQRNASLRPVVCASAFVDVDFSAQRRSPRRTAVFFMGKQDVVKRPFVDASFGKGQTRIAFAWMVFWGAAWCVKERGHLCVDALLSTFPKKMRALVEIIINIVLLGFFLFLIVVGGQFAATGMTQTAPYLPIPMTLYYAAIPSAAVLMVYYMVQVIAEDICTLFKKEEEKA